MSKQELNDQSALRKIESFLKQVRKKGRFYKILFQPLIVVRKLKCVQIFVSLQILSLRFSIMLCHFHYIESFFFIRLDSNSEFRDIIIDYMKQHQTWQNMLQKLVEVRILSSYKKSFTKMIAYRLMELFYFVVVIKYYKIS